MFIGRYGAGIPASKKSDAVTAAVFCGIMRHHEERRLTEMVIRRGKREDIDEISRVYDRAKAFMEATGNRSQWLNGYPGRALIEDDIAKGQCYVCEKDGKIHGVFAFILGEDPTYGYIEDGSWKNDAPYGTIHRIGSDGEEKGVFAACVAFCKTLSGELRIDTHRDNAIMQRLCAKHGFERRGIIYIDDGTPRIAYQYSAETKE